METNQPWNWRLAALKTTKMVLVWPLMISFKISTRDNYAVSACSPLLLSIKALAPRLLCVCVCVCVVVVGGVGLWTDVHPSPQVGGIWNKANFPLHQPGLFIAFWAVSSCTPPRPFSNISTTKTDVIFLSDTKQTLTDITKAKYKIQ
jgi:hypothetical protein